MDGIFSDGGNRRGVWDCNEGRVITNLLRRCCRCWAQVADQASAFFPDIDRQTCRVYVVLATSPVWIAMSMIKTLRWIAPISIVSEVTEGGGGQMRKRGTNGEATERVWRCHCVYFPTALVPLSSHTTCPYH